MKTAEQALPPATGYRIYDALVNGRTANIASNGEEIDIHIRLPGYGTWALLPSCAEIEILRLRQGP